MLYDRRPIFVFGSNLAGRHGKGAAKYALEEFGAIYGQGIGFQGHSYAIPTKNHVLEPLSLDAIFTGVQTFCEFAHEHPELEFEVTAIGCGLAGWDPEDIAPAFLCFMDPGDTNIRLPRQFKDVIARIKAQ
jgi:hypothetical protein